MNKTMNRKIPQLRLQELKRESLTFSHRGLSVYPSFVELSG